jgi:hypothetical protein
LDISFNFSTSFPGYSLARRDTALRLSIFAGSISSLTEANRTAGGILCGFLGIEAGGRILLEEL